MDDNNHIVDKVGNKIFDKAILEDDDIPRVFRSGVLRKDTEDSFSRLMSEIEELERN